MTDMTPNSPLDKLAQHISIMQSELIKINKRLDETDAFMLKVLQLLKQGEETFDLRVARAQYNMFSGLTHTLEHSIDAHVESLKSMKRGFDVEVVDGVNVIENAETIKVVKTESGYDYSRAADEDNVDNTGTELFSKYFDENPQVFGERNSILINITTSLPLQEVTGDVQA